MRNYLDMLGNDFLDNQVVNEVLKSNEYTYEYGLKLSEKDAQEIIRTRNLALKKTGRLEFNGEVVNKVIKKFCDSPYISQYNYSETINELVEIFYNYKNETLDYIGDDELIEIMKDFFDNYCKGSLELLEGKVLYTIASNIRSGFKDYTNISNDKE